MSVCLNIETKNNSETKKKTKISMGQKNIIPRKIHIYMSFVCTVVLTKK